MAKLPDGMRLEFMRVDGGNAVYRLHATRQALMRLAWRATGEWNIGLLRRIYVMWKIWRSDLG